MECMRSAEDRFQESILSYHVGAWVNVRSSDQPEAPLLLGHLVVPIHKLCSCIVSWMQKKYETQIIGRSTFTFIRPKIPHDIYVHIWVLYSCIYNICTILGIATKHTTAHVPSPRFQNLTRAPIPLCSLLRLSPLSPCLSHFLHLGSLLNSLSLTFHLSLDFPTLLWFYAEL